MKLEKEKIDSPDADDDEIKISYDNFNVIGQSDFDEKMKEKKSKSGSDGGLTFEETKIK